MKFLLDENMHIGLLSFLTSLKHNVTLYHYWFYTQKKNLKVYNLGT